MESRKSLAPHTVLQLCDSENAETLQIYYSVPVAVVVFSHRWAVSGRICRSRATIGLLRCDSVDLQWPRSLS